ncbi:MAG TPA: MerR family transcriptional regulator, partial [Cytophagaceae bacterium]
MVDQYSIRDLEIITGIKAHTLRIWEQRYSFLVPSRTDTNIRYYSGNQLRELLNICVLYNHGVKISQIAKLDQASIANKVNSIIKDEPSLAGQVDLLIIAMVELDEIKFHKTLEANIAKLGLSESVESIIFPFLRKIGFMWQTGAINPAQEHFITNLIRQKIIAEIDKYPPAGSETKAVLFLPENEMHEISILYYWYLCKKNGIQ